MFEWCSMVLAMTLIWSLGQQNTWLTGLNVCKSSAAANSVSINRYLSSQQGGWELIFQILLLGHGKMSFAALVGCIVICG